MHNSWLPILIRGRIVALALLQALTASATGLAPRRLNRAGRRMRPTAFGKATDLFQLVFRQVETAVLADLRKSDLTQAQRALVELQTVATRLREELNGLVPAFNKTSPTLERENHTGRLVSAVLERIHQRYAQPITLARCAQELRLNAAYLSALFSSHVGMPFKTYLTELRIEKARDLLGEPTRSIADVAYAVGYASENRFRTAFKHVTGLSPRLWRETLRLKPNETASGPVSDVQNAAGGDPEFLSPSSPSPRFKELNLSP